MTEKAASELSCRLANNLKQWVVQANRLIEELERYNTDDQVKDIYKRLRTMHRLLAAELAIWDKYKGSPDVLSIPDGSGDQLIRKIKMPVTVQCIHFRGLGGTKEISCCGGRVKKVPAYNCVMYGLVTTRDCRNCKRYIDGTQDLKYKADYLITVKGCEDCDRVEAAIIDTAASGRRLHVRRFDTDEEILEHFKAIGIGYDDHAPCFIENFDPNESNQAISSCEGDIFDIIGRLRSLGYSGAGAGLPVDSCVFSGKELSVEDGEKQWACSLYDKTCRSRCVQCSRYIPQWRWKSDEAVDLLVGFKGDDDTSLILSKIAMLNGLRRDLKVINAVDYQQARRVLAEVLNQSDLQLPALITAYDPNSTMTTGGVQDKLEDILAYLTREAYIIS